MTGGAAVTCPMLGVALVPDNAAVRRFVEVAARFGPAWPLAPRLGPSHNLPHVSLMHGRFRDPATARARVEAWVTGLRPPPPLRTAGVEYVPCGWYFLRVARDPWLLAAHDALFAAVADALVVTDADRGKDTTGHSPAERRNVLRYGYRYLGEAFRPHVTLGRTADRRELPPVAAEAVGVAASWADGFTFRVARCACFVVGPNGSLVDEIGSWPLPK